MKKRLRAGTWIHALQGRGHANRHRQEEAFGARVKAFVVRHMETLPDGYIQWTYGQKSPNLYTYDHKYVCRVSLNIVWQLEAMGLLKDEGHGTWVPLELLFAMLRFPDESDSHQRHRPGGMVPSPLRLGSRSGGQVQSQDIQGMRFSPMPSITMRIRSCQSH